MTNLTHDDGSKRVKRIAAVIYLLIMAFVVGGSYINQHYVEADIQTPSAISKN